MGNCWSLMKSSPEPRSEAQPTEAPTSANYRTAEFERVRSFMDLISFTYQELCAATNNFQEKLGKGGFGPVYKGQLPPSKLRGWSRPVPIAVKRLSVSSQQGIREFEAEIRNLSRISHKNLVKVLGYCVERINKDRATRHIMIVYEFVANRSLDYLLYQSAHNRNECKWAQRLSILREVAQALLYLHEELARSKLILHRDIKPSNIMLDESYNPKLGDFGLSRMLENGARCYETETLRGTRGYLAPELYGSNVKFTKKTDMYSFGVVLLEAATGKRPLERVDHKPSASRSTYPIAQPLVESVQELQQEGRLLEAADKRLHGLFEWEEMRRVLVAGLACCHPDPQARPSVREVVDVLSGAESVPVPCSYMLSILYTLIIPVILGLFYFFSKKGYGFY